MADQSMADLYAELLKVEGAVAKPWVLLAIKRLEEMAEDRDVSPAEMTRACNLVFDIIQSVQENTKGA